ncbi:Putative cytosolic protein, partial (plasmid) [Borrelia parkeri SLO]
MSDLFDLEYYSKEIASVINDVSTPEFYKWLADEQFEYINLKTGFVKSIKWDAFANKNPTALIDEVNVISTMGFRSETIMLNYLKLQYKFRHINQYEENFYTHNGYIGNPNNSLLPFREAFKLTSDEIIKIIDHFILTGTVTV